MPGVEVKSAAKLNPTESSCGWFRKTLAGVAVRQLGRGPPGASTQSTVSPVGKGPFTVMFTRPLNPVTSMAMTVAEADAPCTTCTGLVGLFTELSEFSTCTLEGTPR